MEIFGMIILHALAFIVGCLALSGAEMYSGPSGYQPKGPVTTDPPKLEQIHHKEDEKENGNI